MIILFKEHFDQLEISRAVVSILDPHGITISEIECPSKQWQGLVSMIWSFFASGVGASLVDKELSDQISEVQGFQKVQNFGSYLGVPLFHEQVTNSTLSFVVEKVHSKLLSLDARKLSLARRVALAQSIPFSIPNYFMQIMMIPKGVCAKTE
ncbi:hypothetical protein J1N35_026502 [Gossypium stocksii]|uniref:Uncharacterized protein n=1 Tax=Gossypium stocksii TaxID=47602 RepID=A0A9D3V807_9ROSI|nr:hypothetical protein J1N35_026502 [Gossypium stocksii]